MDMLWSVLDDFDPCNPLEASSIAACGLNSDIIPDGASVSHAPPSSSSSSGFHPQSVPVYFPSFCGGAVAGAAVGASAQIDDEVSSEGNTVTLPANRSNLDEYHAAIGGSRVKDGSVSNAAAGRERMFSSGNSRSRNASGASSSNMSVGLVDFDFGTMRRSSIEFLTDALIDGDCGGGEGAAAIAAPARDGAIEGSSGGFGYDNGVVGGGGGDDVDMDAQPTSSFQSVSNISPTFTDPRFSTSFSGAAAPSSSASSQRPSSSPDGATSPSKKVPSGVVSSFTRLRKLISIRPRRKSSRGGVAKGGSGGGAVLRCGGDREEEPKRGPTTRCRGVMVEHDRRLGEAIMHESWRLGRKSTL